jgi:hypothetical protein
LLSDDVIALCVQRCNEWSVDVDDPVGATLRFSRILEDDLAALAFVIWQGYSVPAALSD